VVGGAGALSRSAHIARRTRETDVDLRLTLDGQGAGERETGVGFFDHMLDLLARHGALDLDVRVRGDLQTGSHHTVEDTGLALGRALDEALGDRAGVTRYGLATVPMDEARATAVVDLSGRPYTVWEGQVPHALIGSFETELCEEFMRAVASAGRLTLHVGVERGGNVHHVVEAVFKAFARALRQATALDPRQAGVPSTKGVL
jgi:imidazoleglycerol-phosphate dehydratase